MIDEVKVYRRALSPVEIRAEFKKDGVRRNSMFGLEFPRIHSEFTIKHGAVTVAADRKGAIQIASGKSSFALESEFSYPGPKIGFNSLPGKSVGQENSWRPRITRLDKASLQIEAEGNFYSLNRIVRLGNERIELEDTFTSRTQKPVAVMISHHLIAPEKFSQLPRDDDSRQPDNFLFIEGRRFWDCGRGRRGEASVRSFSDHESRRHSPFFSSRWTLEKVTRFVTRFIRFRRRAMFTNSSIACAATGNRISPSKARLNFSTCSIRDSKRQVHWPNI